MSTNTVTNEVFIRDQIDQTRSQVKFVDLFGGIMLLAVAIIGWLLLVAIIDAWLFDLGIVGRLCALLVLVGGSIGWFVVKILPALVGRVNPLYAAKTIEDTQPSFKNRLINLLTLRKNRAGISQSVYSAMEDQAATQLNDHPVEGAVDKTTLFRIGYLLAGLFVVAVGYSVLSPKSPFPSFARIAAPFAQIARPSRVLISEISPGDGEVIVGDNLTVSAKIKGLRTDEVVNLIFTTKDGQSQDRTVPMKLDEAGLHYVGEISPTPGGVQQDFAYRIEAGDAISPTYEITARQAPAMFVERLELTYPAYTGLGSRTIEGAGDIDAIEGTHVVVVARSNLPMASAYIEFEVDPPQEGQPVRRAEIIPMQIDGLTARGKIVLELRPDRKTPMHSGYKVRFATENQESNEDAATQRIVVRPDLSPEIAILSPSADPAKVAENGELEIQVRALDPDYAVTKISLKAKSGESSLFDKALLQAQPGETGQVVKSFTFRPQDYGLVAGDEVLYRASVADNRVSSAGWLPEPNEARTRYRTIVVTASTSEDRRPNTGDAKTEEGDSDSSNENRTDPKNENKGDNTSETKPNQQEDAGSEKPKTDKGDSTKPESGSTNETQKSDKPNEKPERNTGENSGEGNTGDSEMTEGTEGGAGSESTESQPSGEGNTGTSETGSASQQTGEGASSSDTPPGVGQTSPSDGSKPSQGEPSGETGDQPVDSNEKLHDGEVIEKINDLIEAMKSLNDEQLDQVAKGQQPKNEDAKNEKPEQPSGEKDPELTPEQEQRLKELAKRIQEHREQRKKEQQEKKGGGGVSTGQDRPDPTNERNNDNTGGGSSSTQQPKKTGEQPAGGEKTDATPMAEGQKTTGDKAPEDGGSGGETPDASTEGSSTEETTDAEPGNETPANTANQTPSETGPKEESEGGVEPEKGNPSDKPPQGNEGVATSEPGESAGTENQNDIPPSGGKPTPKPGEAKETRETGKPQSSSDDKTDQMEGDGEGFAGGEEAGGEQSSGKPGEGGSGASSPSDSGSGAANEKGDGPTGKRAGEGAESQNKTGKPGENEGAGSKTEAGGEKSGPSDQAGDAKQPGEGTNNQPGGRGEGETTSGDRSSGKPGQGSAGKPGGGEPGSNQPAGSDLTGELTEPEKANLEYARKATDLALDFLEQEKEKPSDELLKELNMTPEELAAFVNRWNAMKRGSTDTEANSSREFEESLRNLGLQTPADKRAAAAAENDALKGLRDAGSRSIAPDNYLEQFRAFKQGASR